ncbi:hypothetical protein F4556_005203 [Kitasatospora gansuensis]|uniref:Uncharacterized protein n=1 Tax=Kitasatospora gansuensis TaxID=258050 RepID=A0A7W7SFT2_9ACTN|nr:hypothetical protein [Kitasatospora gansuensis]MBB4949668.1 hypothetical protein [Kitasatospora gansuensis]
MTPTVGTLYDTQLHGLPGLDGWTLAAFSTLLDTDGRTALLSVRSRPGQDQFFATGTLTQLPRDDRPVITGLITTGLRPTRIVLTSTVSTFSNPDAVARAASTALHALAPHIAAARPDEPLGVEAVPALEREIADAVLHRELADTALNARNTLLQRIGNRVQPAVLVARTGLSKASISALTRSGDAGAATRSA